MHMKEIIKRNIRKVYLYFSYKKLACCVKEYGYQYPLKKYLEAFFVMIAITFATGIFYQLKIPYIAAVVLTGIICMPQLMKVYFTNKYKQKKFNDVDIYIHQMAYSFQRQPKINIALEDTYKVSGSNMKKYIGKAIDEMQYDNTDQVYERALGIIEKEYPNSRISTLHKFMINVEKNGGNYHTSLDVLILDFDNWVKGVYKYQQDIKRVKTTLTVGIILSFILASASVLIAFILKNMSEIQIDITNENLYQICSTAFLIISLLFYVYTRSAFNGDWVKKGRSDKKIEKDYKMAFHTDVKNLFKISMPLYAVVAVVAVILVIIKMYIWAVVLIAAGIYMLCIPQINIKNAKKRINEDVYDGFSDWLRDVALNLQKEPLMLAIEDTYDNCPVVIKESLQQFIVDIENNPLEVTPYYDFMSIFGILDISSTVRTLYSLAELSPVNADMTINNLIKRNYELMDKHEANKNNDRISAMKFAEYIPTVFVSFKIAVDMMLVITNYL